MAVGQLDHDVPTEEFDHLGPCQRFVQLAVLHTLPILGVPQQIVGDLRQGIGRAAPGGRVGDGRDPVPRAEDLVHHHAHAMDVLLADLHEAASAFVQQLAREQQAIPQVGQVGVDAELPGVPEGADRLRLAGQVLVPSVGHVLPMDEGLEVGAVADAVGRIDVDHLHLPAEALLLQEAVHHQQAVAGDQAVGPVVPVPVEVDGLPDRRVLLRGVEQGALEALAPGLRAVALPHRLHDGARVDALVDVQGDGGDLERRVFGLARPGELRVDVGIVGPGLAARVPVGLRRDQADGRVVHALLARVRVVLDVALTLLRCFRHDPAPIPPPSAPLPKGGRAASPSVGYAARIRALRADASGSFRRCALHRDSIFGAAANPCPYVLAVLDQLLRQLVRFLRIHPEFRSLPEIRPQRDRGLRTHAAASMHNLMQPGRRQADVPGDAIDGQPHLPDLFEQQGAGMRRDPIAGYTDHFLCSLERIMQLAHCYGRRTTERV